MESVNVCKFCNMEDGQCCCVGFILMPRQLTDVMAEVLAEKARVCGGGAFEIWGALIDARPTVAADFDRVSAEKLALQQRLTVQDQRVDDAVDLLRGCEWIADGENQFCPECFHFDDVGHSADCKLSAFLNPTAEAESHE